MEKGTKIFLWTIGGLAIAGTTYALIRRHFSKKEDNLQISFGNIDWTKRQIPYTILNNGKFSEGGTLIWRGDLVGKGEQLIGGDAKNSTYQTNLTNGFIIRGESLGKQKFGKTVDFDSRNIKDYVGGSVNEALSGASNAIKNLFV